MEKETLVIPADRVKPLIADGKVFRSAYDFKLTEKDLEQAYEELGETEKVRRSSLQALKKKLSGTPNLHHHTDEEILLRYLRYQKFDVDKAYTKLTQLYRMRSDYPEYFATVSDLEAILSLNLVQFLPYRTEEGSLISMMDFRRLDLDRFAPVDGVKLLNALADTYSMNPGIQVNKYMCIWDMRGVTPRHCWQYLNPKIGRMMLRLFLETYPWRIKQVILLHCSQIIHAAFSVARLFLKKKIADRIVLLGSDVSELHQYVNPKILPKEYGGDIDEKECSIDEFLLKNVSFMKYENSFKFIPP